MNKLVPFLFSFLASMSREIAKDIEDMAREMAGGVRALSILDGVRLSSALAAVGLSFLSPFGRGYLEVVAVADIFFLLSVKMILQGNSTGAQKVLKPGMAAALAAFLAAALLY